MRALTDESGTSSGGPDAKSSGVTCPHCGVSVDTSDTYCEECGSLIDIARCTRCSAFLDWNGSCEQCGDDAANSLHHSRCVLGNLAAGTCDRGVVRRANQDAMALRVVPAGVVVSVADGVSSSPRSSVASSTAAHAFTDTVAGHLDTGAAANVALRRGLAAAFDAVADIRGPHGDAPATTLVAAAVTADELAVISVGDSRAYVIIDGVLHRVTTDDSWREEAIARLGFDEATADADPRAHQITRWLGADAPSDTVTGARLRRFPRPDRGWLILCSDGLWNEVSEPEIEALATAADGRDPEELAIQLWHSALEAGGRDNISVVTVNLDSAAATDLSSSQGASQE